MDQPASARNGRGQPDSVRLEDTARELGWKRVRLDTNRALKEAQTMYRKAGYHEIGRYNDNPYADYWFEKDL